MLAKFQTLHRANVTDLSLGSGTVYIITHCHFLSHRHTVYERLESLQEASGKPLGNLEICALSPLHFVQPVFPWVRELLPGFTICSAELQIQTSLNNLKNNLP